MSEDNRLEDLLLLWEERRERGEDVRVEVLCGEYPDLIPAVTAGIESLRRLEWVKQVETTGTAPDGTGTHPAPPPVTDTLRIVGGRYLLYRRLGEGGFGEVWRGFDLIVERAVAVKVPKKNRIGSAEEADGFLAEARKAASLDHPGIVPVYDVALDGGAYYIVSKLVEGTDLERRLRSGPVAVREAAEIVAQVARHLHFAHRKGLVHRDIKPANLLVDERGAVFVTDFGIAVTADAIRSSGADGMGTLAYMGPERLSGDGTSVDARTDIYSLGVVLYRLVAGRLPFEAEAPSDLVDGIVNRQPSPPRAFNADVPGAIERVCLKCLEKNPANRYPTAEALAHELENWLRRAPLRHRAVKAAFWIGSLCGVLALMLGLALALDRKEASTVQKGSGETPELPEKPPEKQPAPLPRFREVRSIDAHPGAVLAVAFSADGRQALSGGADAIRVWDVSTGRQLDPVTVANRPIGFRSVAFSPDGKKVLAYGRPVLDDAKSLPGGVCGLELWDTETRRLLHRSEWAAPLSARLFFAPDGRRFAWAWASPEQPPEGRTPHPMRGSPGLRFRGFELWDAEGWKQTKDVWDLNLTLKNGPATPWAVAFPTGGEAILFATGGYSGSSPGVPIYLLDTTAGRIRTQFDGQKGSIRALACLPDGRGFLSGGDDEIIRVWDTATGAVAVALGGHTGNITALAVSPTGRRALSAAADGTVRLWDLKTKEQIHAFTGHKGSVISLAFSPDGRSALYGAGDGTLRVLALPAE